MSGSKTLGRWRASRPAGPHARHARPRSDFVGFLGLHPGTANWQALARPIQSALNQLNPAGMKRPPKFPARAAVPRRRGPASHRLDASRMRALAD